MIQDDEKVLIIEAFIKINAKYDVSLQKQWISFSDAEDEKTLETLLLSSRLDYKDSQNEDGGLRNNVGADNQNEPEQNNYSKLEQLAKKIEDNELEVEELLPELAELLPELLQKDFSGESNDFGNS
jgi:hypothetical protein